MYAVQRVPEELSPDMRSVSTERNTDPACMVSLQGARAEVASWWGRAGGRRLGLPSYTTVDSVGKEDVYTHSSDVQLGNF